MAYPIYKTRHSQIRKNTEYHLAPNAEILLEYCHKLLEKFHYPWEMMPLMYVILKYAGADIDEATRRIDEGQIVVNEYSRQHNLNIFDGAALRDATRQCG
ncbi:protein doublesex-like [Condylostylus longicornis]|uniref:protein doublesex-like n=1 Tax=Condylostylus longicornis TaxID=2530218 RepID=UPI00244DB435|nr:protein doublesex-like [Condylostylus longicornis]